MLARDLEDEVSIRPADDNEIAQRDNVRALIRSVEQSRVQDIQTSFARYFV